MSASVVRSMPCWCRSWVAAATSRSRFPGRRSVAVVWPWVESVISLVRIQVLLIRAVSRHQGVTGRLGGAFCIDHDERGCFPRVADAKGKHGGGRHQDATDEQGLVVAGIRGHEMWCMSRNQVVGAGDRNCG